jgi:hypothetical protein
LASVSVFGWSVSLATQCFCNLSRRQDFKNIYSQKTLPVNRKYSLSNYYISKPHYLDLKVTLKEFFAKLKGPPEQRNN